LHVLACHSAQAIVTHPLPKRTVSLRTSFRQRCQLRIPLDRGNDFAFADVLDGVGSSVFPTWWQMDDAAFANFTVHVHSAARNKKGIEPHNPVLPADQQKWIWGAIAGGIDTLLFWCWRDKIIVPTGIANGLRQPGASGF